MTNDKIALRELLETGSDTGFLREMIGFTAERLMALETESLCAAAPGERAVERQNQRNGVSIRPVTRRSGQAATAGLWNFSRQFQGRSSCRRWRSPDCSSVPVRFPYQTPGVIHFGGGRERQES